MLWELRRGERLRRNHWDGRQVVKRWLARRLDGDKRRPVENVPELLPRSIAQPRNRRRWEQQRELLPSELQEEIVDHIEMQRGTEPPVAQPQIGHLNTLAHGAHGTRGLQPSFQPRESLNGLMSYICLIRA